MSGLPVSKLPELLQAAAGLPNCRQVARVSTLTRKAFLKTRMYVAKHKISKEHLRAAELRLHGASDWARLSAREQRGLVCLVARVLQRGLQPENYIFSLDQCVSRASTSYQHLPCVRPRSKLWHGDRLLTHWQLAAGMGLDEAALQEFQDHGISGPFAQDLMGNSIPVPVMGALLLALLSQAAV